MKSPQFVLFCNGQLFGIYGKFGNLRARIKKLLKAGHPADGIAAYQRRPLKISTRIQIHVEGMKGS